MTSVSEFAGDEVKIPLHHLPLFPSPPLHRCQLVLSMFLVLIDSYVSYTLLRSTSMLQYTVMIRKLGMIDDGTGESEKHAMETCHDGTKKPPMITAASHVASGLMLAPVASVQPKLTNPGPATWPNDGCISS
jgi:hypothetical protein